MATAVSDTVKVELKARGLWGDFLRRREDVKAERKCGSCTANKVVIGEMVADGRMPAEFAEEVKGRGRPKKEVEKPAEVVHEVSSAATLADARRAKRDAKAAVEAGSSVKVAERKVTSRMFEGRSCSFLKSFMWAYENIRFTDVKPKDAPSAIAWNLMMDMRSSPSLRADLSKAALTKSIAKSDDDDSSSRRFDGEAEYDLLGVLANGGGG